MQAIVEDFRAQTQRRLEDAKNLELIFGEASFSSRNTVEVRLNAGGTRTLAADTIFIDTGARPARTENRRARFRECSRFHFNHGARRAAGTLAGAGRRLRRSGIRPDVSPFW